MFSLVSLAKSGFVDLQGVMQGSSVFPSFAQGMKWNEDSGRKGVKGCVCRSVFADIDQCVIL